MRTWVGGLAAGSIGLAALSAHAAPAIDADPMGGAKIRVDGVLKEWPARFFPLSEAVKGEVVPGPVTARIGYDETSIFLAIKTHDDKIARSPAATKNEDHSTLTLAFPGPDGRFTTHEIDVYPGDPGKTAGVVKDKAGVVPGAKVVEAPSRGGLDIEAQIPWSRFPEAARVRVGLRAALAYTDADRVGNVRSIVANATVRTGTGLPALRLEAEQALEVSLIAPKSLPETPARQLFGNVAGDGFVERVAIYGAYLTIVGPHYRGGSQFYFAELGVPASSAVTRLQLADFDGDGVDEIVIQKRIGSSDEYREVLQVLKIGANDAPSPVLAHEVAIKTKDGNIANQVRVVRQGKGAQIEIAQGTALGFDAENFHEPLSSDMPSALLPWQTIGKRTYTWQKSGFEKTEEGGFTPKLSAPKHKARAEAPEPPAPPPPRPPTADELLDRLYALYRKERGVGAAPPRFDFVTDVAGDARTERVLVHGKDIVVFGKGFRGGTTFAFITIGVADPKDVLGVTARDLTGDGKAEIIVRGVLHAKASKALGGDVVDRQAFFVYRVGEAALSRVFAAETGRALGNNRIIGGLVLKPGTPAFEIELRRGRAVGWTEQSYPFPPDTTAAGGLEPLLLPWTSSEGRRYHFDGANFVLQ